jgi:hypothetical protein
MSVLFIVDIVSFILYNLYIVHYNSTRCSINSLVGR